MRRAFLPAILLVGAAIGCGRGTPGFVIDQVTISPDSVPIGSTSTEPLKIGAQVKDDLHTVQWVWAVSEDARIWIDLQESLTTDGSYGGSIAVSSLQGFAVGDYWFDVHASDDEGREVVLAHAVRLKID